MSAIGDVSGAGRSPTVGAGIIPPAGVQIAISAPDDHFGTSPHCRVIVSTSGRTGGARASPTVGARIVSPAGVKQRVAVAVVSAPDDHFTAGPRRRVKGPGSGRS